MTSLATTSSALFSEICEQVAAYRAGRDAFRDLDATLDAIETDGRPVWISVMPRDQAHALLAAAKARLDAGEDLPLFGIPFGVKDNIDVAGLETTGGCPQFAFKPQASAFAVDRLIKAGAIPVGKTNLDQFATGLNGTRSPYGIPSCAFDANYISGGSSSGSAVAVAKGLVPFALGTDTAGSGRVPAGFNNIVGMKPSKGLISTRGVLPACRTLDCVSILACTTQDALTVLRAVSIPDDKDAYSRANDDAAVAKSLNAFRFGVITPTVVARCAPGVTKRYAAAVSSLQALGGSPVEIDYAPFEAAASLLYAGPWVAERYAAISDFAESQPESIHPVVREIVTSGTQYSAVDAFTAQYSLADHALKIRTALNNIDFLLVPTAPEHPTIEDMLADPVALNSKLGLFTNFVNLMDMAAISVPFGWGDGGLPVGVTLIGPQFSDGMLAHIGDRLHRTDPGARLGAGSTPLAQTNAVVAAASEMESVRLAVVGAHLQGQPLNRQLTDRGASLVLTTRTSAGYSLYSLPNSSPAKPGLSRDGGPGGIEIELWDVPVREFGSFVAAIPAPLGIGSVETEDGTVVKGFICEHHALADAENITAFGGWRRYLAARSANQNTPAIAIAAQETRP
ncbi:allophanate hydrolase [Devosia sp. XJ19-1]|uniref:Allophanate hydrolase n=1 Tax=Devosia ureilytica TaxID=2952754 RepID=A0A9Q4FRE1_9HYPH|nr:allophanate hydrolase [Devosia ureilytica]MCP8882399.1 allophanate hydrolase [Devosia ureilytica]MCP8885714.1 allophanate hydrolase [Devosia ureilytica]